jgi:sugar transferase (PEP-CTERM/EpsH1 system associated)
LPFIQEHWRKKSRNGSEPKRSIASCEYVRHISTIPKIMDFVDADSGKWRLFADHHPRYLAWLYRLEADRLSQYEEAVANAFEWSVFVSTEEAESLRQRVHNRTIVVIPNGVDVDYFAPGEAHSATSKLPVVVFTGAMDYFPNVDAVRYFCREMLPLIHKALPETQFYIVGRQPTRQVRALGQQQNVMVTGWVPDVRPYLARARVAVAPLRIARGVQNKILEAMAMGVPVVSTSVALQGIRATAEDGIRIADTPQHFAQEVLSLLQNPVLQRQCAFQVRRYVLKHHRWEEHGASIMSLLHAR